MTIVLRVLVLVALLTLGSAPAATAKKLDGLTPSQETDCDGLKGRAFGLCNAYCEAMDCDLQLEPGQACESVRGNFFRLTGNAALPCDEFCPVLTDLGCSGNGWLVVDNEGCDACACDEGWSGSSCATCDEGFAPDGECLGQVWE